MIEFQDLKSYHYFLKAEPDIHIISIKFYTS